jgi:hypothetical protein
MNNLLTVENATQYLENMYFTEIKFTEQIGENLYFSAIDEDDIRKEIEFQPITRNENVICSVKEDERWIILEILED